MFIQEGGICGPCYLILRPSEVLTAGIFAEILVRVFLKEDVTRLRLIGTPVIIIGITLVARDGGKRTGSTTLEAQSGASLCRREGKNE